MRLALPWPVAVAVVTEVAIEVAAPGRPPPAVLARPVVAVATEAASLSPASLTGVPAASPPFARAVVEAALFLGAPDAPEERLRARGFAPSGVSSVAVLVAVPLGPAVGFDDESYLSSLPAEVTLAAWMALILAIQLGWGCTLRTVRSSSEV